MSATSFRAFAKAVGVSHTVALKGAKTGRLSKSLGVDGHGKPIIADLDLAIVEWGSNAGKLPNAGRRNDEELSEELAAVLIASLRYVLSQTPARRFVTEHAHDRTYFDAPALLAWLEAR